MFTFFYTEFVNECHVRVSNGFFFCIYGETSFYPLECLHGSTLNLKISSVSFHFRSMMRALKSGSSLTKSNIPMFTKERPNIRQKKICSIVATSLTKRTSSITWNEICCKRNWMKNTPEQRILSITLEVII